MTAIPAARPDIVSLRSYKAGDQVPLLSTSIPLNRRCPSLWVWPWTTLRTPAIFAATGARFTAVFWTRLTSEVTDWA